MKIPLPILKSALIILTATLFITTCLQLVFIGKNLTFSTKFSPPSSEQNRLRNQTYYIEAQVLLIFMAIVNVLLLPLATYSAFRQRRTAFMPLWVAVVVVNGLLVVLNIYFLVGAGEYRGYMNRQIHEMMNLGLCESDSISLCMVGNCVRLQVYYQAKSMAIAYTVIEIICMAAFSIISILVNRKQKDPRKMQLIV